MKLLKEVDKTIIIRISAAVLLAIIALGLFWMNNNKSRYIPKEISQDLIIAAKQIDHEVDSVLVEFDIHKHWGRKRQIAVAKTNLYRTERRMLIPPDALPIQINLALNAMAKRYNGRAIASENMKDNSVTIHIEVDGYIVETVI
ncbi:MAG: hypothetical protein HY707_03375, partial [Ignavibacteriae bacterium]|nr:hypothetical protein [Ignavibacteriota bacterium]